MPFTEAADAQANSQAMVAAVNHHPLLWVWPLFLDPPRSMAQLLSDLQENTVEAQDRTMYGDFGYGSPQGSIASPVNHSSLALALLQLKLTTNGKPPFACNVNRSFIDVSHKSKCCSHVVPWMFLPTPCQSSLITIPIATFGPWQ